MTHEAFPKPRSVGALFLGFASRSGAANHLALGETQPFYSSADPLAELVTIHECSSPILCVLYCIVPQAAADGNSAPPEKAFVATWS